MSRTFRFTLRIKGCEQEFREGMGAGVLLTQEVVYKTAPKKDTPMFAKELMDRADEILQANVEMQIEEVE